MMKLLYIPTNNIFTLPDEDAIRYRNQDPANYRILDAGYTKEEAPVQVSEDTVKQIVMEQDSKKEEEQEPNDSIASSVVVEEQQEKQEEVDLTKLSKEALLGYCRRLGIKGMTKGQKTKAQMIEAIQKVTVENIAGE